MKKVFLLLTVIAGAISVALTACTEGDAKVTGDVVISHDSLVRRGSYLVSSIGCDDCHSPKIFNPNGGVEIDMEHRLSGHPANAVLGKADISVMKNGYMLFALDLTSAAGPWGQSYAANLTSDPTGIGNWTEEQFFTAIREGKYKGAKEGRSLLPPMPWFVYRNLNDTDLKAIFAFLKSTKPVRNVVPGPKTVKELQ